MFGYVVINEPELKIKDYREYRGVYCGLCQTLKRKYGPFGQLCLNNDMTFMALLHMSLYGMRKPDGSGCTGVNCIRHENRKSMRTHVWNMRRI